MSYPDSVQYLYALGNELKAGAKFGLERMQALLDGLGHPEYGQRFVHVAGTNGKGSTSAMIASALQRSGYRTGLFTSPHLIEPTERIQLDGQAISREDFAAAFARVHVVAEQMLNKNELDAHPSYFETVTAMAITVFKERCDISVMEVGLGGRLDATNVITPELCVITPISYDHESYLGNTINAIAGEKAGILKPGIPAIVARQSEAAAQVIMARAHELDVELTHTADHAISDVEATPYGSSFSLDGDRYQCSLPGRHQIENATAAVLACRKLGLPVAAIQAGLNSVVWPGRLEFVSRAPDFVLDGAHNPAGAAALAAYIREFCANRPVWLVYGAMRDKAIDEVTAQLFPLAERLIVSAPNFPRALRPEAILDITTHPNVQITASIGEAIQTARTAPREAIVFFSGSLFLVGEARQWLVE